MSEELGSIMPSYLNHHFAAFKHDFCSSHQEPHSFRALRPPPSPPHRIYDFACLILESLSMPWGACAPWHGTIAFCQTTLLKNALLSTRIFQHIVSKKFPSCGLVVLRSYFCHSLEKCAGTIIWKNVLVPPSAILLFGEPPTSVFQFYFHSPKFLKALLLMLLLP